MTGQVDGKKALLAMIALDEIRGRLAEARGGKPWDFLVTKMGQHFIKCFFNNMLYNA